MEGLTEEKADTERERKRADGAEKRADEAEVKVRELEAKLVPMGLQFINRTRYKVSG